MEAQFIYEIAYHIILLFIIPFALCTTAYYFPTKLDKIINRLPSPNRGFANQYISLHQLMDAFPSTLIGVNSQGIILYCNNSVTEDTQISPDKAIGHSIFEIFPDLGISKNLFEQVIAQQQNQSLESMPQEKQGTIYYYDVMLSPLNYSLNLAPTNEINGCLIRIDDVTDRVNLESLMIQNEKMLSIGELAAGMAHEINNPLSAILQSTQNIFRRCSSDVERNKRVAQESGTDLKQINQYMQKREITKILHAIQEAGEQAVSIVRNLLEFSKKAPQMKQEVSVEGLVKNCLNLIKSNSELKAIVDLNRIEFLLDKPNDLVRLPCNKNEIQQVIFNLLKNSIHAIAEKNSLNNTQPTKAKIKGIIKIKLNYETQLFSIEISDNGTGMSNYTVNRLFDPFYTTKQPGKGSGLGLAISYFIITNHHGGSISVHSNLNEGTHMKIKLPSQMKRRKDLSQPPDYLLNPKSIPTINTKFKSLNSNNRPAKTPNLAH